MPEQRELVDPRVSKVFVAATRMPWTAFTTSAILAFGFHVAVYRDVDAIFGWAVAVVVVIAATCRVLVSEPPYTGNLPGVADGPLTPLSFQAVTFQRCAQVGLVVTVIAALLPLHHTVLLILAVLTLVPWAVSVFAAVRRERQVRRIRRALNRHAPVIGIPYAGYDGGPSQIAMWEPYLSRSGLPGVLFNWRSRYFTKIVEGTDPTWPLIQLSIDREADVARLLPASLRALFYVHNATENQCFMALVDEHVSHVWVGHGDSDKPASYLSRHSGYDWLVVAGQAAIDRYTEHDVTIPREKFVILGRPQTSDIQRMTGPIAAVDRPTVLYAPTWHGKTKTVDFSSLTRCERLIRTLIARDVRIIFRPHPLSYWWPRKRVRIEKVQSILATDPDGGHIWGPQADTEWGVVDCINACDVLISDVSSVVSDFLQSEKPYAMFSMRHSVEDFRAEFPVARSGYVILGNSSNLDEVLDEMFGPDPLAEARAERRRDVLGDFNGQESPDAFAEFVRGLVRGT